MEHEITKYYFKVINDKLEPLKESFHQEIEASVPRGTEKPRKSG